MIRKSTLLGGAALAAMLVLSSSAFAVPPPDSDTATATATIVPDISVTQFQNLLFGKFSSDDSGTVNIEHGGTVTPGGLTNLGGAAQQRAYFNVAGAPNTNYSILATIGASSGCGAGGDITLGGANNTPPSPDTLDGAGNDGFGVGAELTLSGAQSPGDCSATITATVEYQ